MYNIKLLNKISASGLSNFDKNNFAYGSDAENPDGILVRSAAMHDMEFDDKLLCIGRAGAGVNNIPIDRCSEKGIVVFNTPGANANAVKELALCALLLSSRKIIDAINWVGTIKGEGDKIPALIEKNKSNFTGPELKGKTLGVIGLGAIGAQLANVAVSLGMEVYGYDPFLTVDAAWMLSRSIKHALDEKTVYENCDYISIHIPYNNETKNKFNKDIFNSMKDGVRIINLARGELMNNTDLVEALSNGKIASYVTDFPNAEIIGLPNTVCIPHLAASTPESEENCAVMAVNEISDYILYGKIRNSVNLPNVELPFSSGTLLSVIHKNIPYMINKITEVVSAEGINIENMANRSKKEIACTLLHVDGDIPETVADKLNAIDGIVRARLIK